MTSHPRDESQTPNPAAPHRLAAKTRRPIAANVLAPVAHLKPPASSAAVCLMYAAAREDLAEVVYWLFASPELASFPLIWDGKHLAPAEPSLVELAELIELVCEYNELPEVLAWTLIEIPRARELRDRLLELMHAAGTWKTEGGAMGAVLASRELDLLVADATWHDPTQILNDDTVPAGVAWTPILRLCEARLQHAAASGIPQGRLPFVLESLRRFAGLEASSLASERK